MGRPKAKRGGNQNDSLGDIATDWARGSSFTTGATHSRENNAYPAECPNQCGTIVRRTTPEAAEIAAREHAQNPDQCRKNPNRRTRR